MLPLGGTGAPLRGGRAAGWEAALMCEEPTWHGGGWIEGVRRGAAELSFSCVYTLATSSESQSSGKWFISCLQAAVEADGRNFCGLR